MLVILKHTTSNIGDDVQRLGLEAVLPSGFSYVDREDRNALESLTAVR